MALRKPCLTAGCPNYTRTGSRCAVHSKTTQRGYDSAWQRVSAVVIERDGYQCQLNGPHCTTVATTADHIVPLSQGGARLDYENLQAACRSCNSSKGGR